MLHVPWTGYMQCIKAIEVLQQNLFVKWKSCYAKMYHWALSQWNRLNIIRQQLDGKLKVLSDVDKDILS